MVGMARGAMDVFMQTLPGDVNVLHQHALIQPHNSDELFGRTWPDWIRTPTRFDASG